MTRARALCERLQTIGPIDGITFSVHPGKGHRFVLLMHADEPLAGPLRDSDPGYEGVPGEPGRAGHRFGARSAGRPPRPTHSSPRPCERLKDAAPGQRHAPSAASTPARIFHCFPNAMVCRRAAVAAYPMYRGLAQLVGMTKVPTDNGPAAEFATYRDIADQYDFAFIHIKATDMYGEDGDFEGKTRAIEEVGRRVAPRSSIRSRLYWRSPAITPPRRPTVVTGGSPYRCSSTPIGRGATVCRAGPSRHSAQGLLGTMRARYLMSILLASAGRLAKFGA